MKGTNENEFCFLEEGIKTKKLTKPQLIVRVLLVIVGIVAGTYLICLTGLISIFGLLDWI